jgi:NAD(P)-dependent dehydrogenase (short-subunit alcohol dehydrogenase family)
MVALGRRLGPKAAVFLASDDARKITAQALNVDGGIVMN